MGISAANKYLLNRYSGSLGGKIQLGTIIEEAGAIAADEIVLAEGDVLIGNASGVGEAQTLSGDATVSAGGVVAIGSGVIVNADVNASAAIDFSKLAALPSAQILVGNGSNVATAVAVTGDVTISNAGVTAIGSGVVVNADVSGSAAIAGSKLAIFAGVSDGTELVYNTAVATYDFAVDGTAASIGLGVSLPDNAVVVNVVQEVITHLNSTSGTTDVTLELPTDGALTAAVTADGSNVGFAVGVPDFATAADWVKTTAARELTLIPTVNDLTAGKARWYVTYFLSE